MAEIIDPEHIALSAAFYEESTHYLRAGLKEYPVTIDCIDPRNKVISEFFARLVTRQTPGGKIGVGHDMAIAPDVSHSLGPASAKEGAGLYSRIGLGIAYPHDNVCRYGQGYSLVSQEEIAPSDHTRDEIERWYGIHNLDPAQKTRSKVRDAQNRHLELTLETSSEQDPEDFVDPNWSDAERAHMHVVGPNLSRFYVVTHPKDILVDRSARRRMGAQGYHDNIGAMLDIYANLKVSGRQREALGILAITRSVATRTVVGAQYADMNYREIFEAPDLENGIEIRTVEGPL
jgi:hypothetical protein